MQFSEIIKLQYEKKKKKKPYIALYLLLFLDYCCLIISEKCMVTPNFVFVDSRLILRPVLSDNYRLHQGVWNKITWGTYLYITFVCDIILGPTVLAC